MDRNEKFIKALGHFLAAGLSIYIALNNDILEVPLFVMVFLGIIIVIHTIWFTEDVISLLSKNKRES